MAVMKDHELQHEAADDAIAEGLFNALLAAIPSGAALALFMRNPNFVKRTNYQSRTAIFIMPPLFVFGLTSEQRLIHRVHIDHQENRHSKETVQWAEKELAHRKTQRDDFNETLHLTNLYQQSIEDSGVSIVPGDTLGLHHRMANYAAENPIKVLAGAAVPAVGAILYGNQSKQHLEFSVALLHTRVFGQFTTLALLLGVMGFKEFMDKNGKFITQAEADARVEEMHRVRDQLKARMHHEKEVHDQQQEYLRKAHEEDVQDKANAKATKA